MGSAFTPQLVPAPIKFGTDGWRGIIAGDFTFERVAKVSAAAARVLQRIYGPEVQSNLIVVGYDRRFLSEEFAEVAAIAAQQAGFEVMLSNNYAPTPAFSWAVKQHQALGALVITASHNPAAYSGLKVKGAFGGSVPPAITQDIQAELEQTPGDVSPGSIQSFDPWPDYCRILRSKVDLAAIQTAIAEDRLTVFVDAMHGATAYGLSQVLDAPVHELRSERDPLFGGNAPEPLPRYLTELIETIQDHAQDSHASGTTVGFVFDGDGDRIAAVDGEGNFLSSQILIPVLINHLAQNRGFSGEVIKTVSGLDLIPKVAQLHGLSVFETPIGYKYIADRMLQSDSVLLGGEESGGIGYGTHIPERDGLLSALYTLEAIAMTGQDLSYQYRQLQNQTGYHSAYDRIDLALSSDQIKQALIQSLESQPPQSVASVAVTDISDQDGYKLRLEDGSWLLIRFSGTEPVLRLYSEAANLDSVHQRLTWAKEWALSYEQ